MKAAFLDAVKMAFLDAAAAYACLDGEADAAHNGEADAAQPSFMSAASACAGAAPAPTSEDDDAADAAEPDTKRVKHGSYDERYLHRCNRATIATDLAIGCRRDACSLARAAMFSPLSRFARGRGTKTDGAVGLLGRRPARVYQRITSPIRIVVARHAIG